MLKRWVFIAVSVLFQVQPLQPQAPSQPGDHPAQAQTQQNPEPQSAAINNADKRQTCEECGKKYPVATDDPDKWVRRGFWLNAGLTIITLIIAIAALLQANAAKMQAATEMDADRAWCSLRASGIHNLSCSLVDTPPESFIK